MVGEYESCNNQHAWVLKAKNPESHKHKREREREREQYPSPMSAPQWSRFFYNSMCTTTTDVLTLKRLGRLVGTILIPTGASRTVTRGSK